MRLPFGRSFRRRERDELDRRITTLRQEVDTLAQAPQRPIQENDARGVVERVRGMLIESLLDTKRAELAALVAQAQQLGHTVEEMAPLTPPADGASDVPLAQAGRPIPTPRPEEPHLQEMEELRQKAAQLRQEIRILEGPAEGTRPRGTDSTALPTDSPIQDLLQRKQGELDTLVARARQAEVDLGLEVADATGGAAPPKALPQAAQPEAPSKLPSSPTSGDLDAGVPSPGAGEGSGLRGRRVFLPRGRGMLIIMGLVATFVVGVLVAIGRQEGARPGPLPSPPAVSTPAAQRELGGAAPAPPAVGREGARVPATAAATAAAPPTAPPVPELASQPSPPEPQPPAEPPPPTDAPAVADGAPPAQTEPGAPTAVKPGRVLAPGFVGANLRAGPSVSTPTLGLLANGTAIQILGDTAQGDGQSWYQVRTPEGTVGWMVSGAVLE